MKGFTLIELLVVMAIFVIITSVTIASNSRFGGRVILETLAYDMALTIRKAQVYGIAVQRFGTTFNRAYGVHFSKVAGSTNQYQLFADVSADERYDTGEEVENFTLRRGYVVTDLCVRSSGTKTCGKTELDVVYKRPEPDAYIRASTAAGAELTRYEAGYVVLKSPRGDTTEIVMEIAGQISVQ